MASVIDYERPRSRAAASHGSGGDGGGTTDDTQNRLTRIEATLMDIRADGAAAKATLTTALPHLATKADLSTLEFRIIRWIVGTAITCTASAFAIARYLN